MSAIRALPDLLINQIAAGEVIERPAAALKELLENALDAGATQVDVELAAGGVKRIRVVDNGSGIEREDLALAVARHATSKIRSVLDLEAIASLGFRGEALASIASVSRLGLASRARSKPHAWRIEVDGGTVSPIAPAALAAGTSITVEELFFNTPARRKFLRTEATEWAHCDEAFRRVALAHPATGFTLQHNARVVHRLVAAGRRVRVEQLLGDDFVLHAATVDADAGGVKLAGFAVRPAYAAQGGGQYLFVNGRYRPRPRAAACIARGLSRRAAPRPAARVRVVARARSAARRRQCASAEDRGALSRFRRNPPIRPACGRTRAGGQRRGTARGFRGGATGRRGRALAAAYATVPKCARRIRCAAIRHERRGAVAPHRNRRSALTTGEPSAFYARLFGPRDDGAAPPRWPPTIRIRWASRWRNCTACTSSRRTAPGSCWSTCTPRTSASSTNA